MPTRDDDLCGQADQGLEARIRAHIRKLSGELDGCQREQAALRVRLTKLNRLVDNLPGMVFRSRADAEWTTEFVSRGCRDLLGFESFQLMQPPQNTYAERMHPEDQERVKRQVDRDLAARRPFQLTFRQKTADGTYKWVWEQGAGVFDPDGRLVAIEGFVTDFTEYKHAEEALQDENVRLRSSIKERYRFGEIVGKSDAMQAVYDFILRAAGSDANVIVYGNSGTGKELVARAIHDMSGRRNRPFVAVNCGAIPESLLESQFFGHKKGAFTGAVTDTSGYLEMADGGTLFLDELDGLTLNLQIKLLRVLEGHEYTPLGGRTPKKPNIRIIAATNRDLDLLVKAGRLREDFFYRIHILPYRLPALKERREDIPLLIDHFLKKIPGGRGSPTLPAHLVASFQHHHWPGNVRELENAVYRYVTMGKLDVLPAVQAAFPDKVAGGTIHPPAGSRSLKEQLQDYEKQIVIQALEQNHWHKGRVAVLLGVDRKTLFNKMRRHGLTSSTIRNSNPSTREDNISRCDPVPHRCPTK